ncbi:MAG: chromosome segregation protein SMC [Lachnospiraceae bacterium]|nr:chromosome segregation protein SMC [Lachnospiraceae bacterium]
MYLKNIVIHGFKSFAVKTKLEFHDGITAIVGPNGSGKSNIADAVRWVLGEQSARLLRGFNMQDVIFSGSEARGPLGFAYVEITFDNSDHKLPIAYDEVSVARRVYRSGESEYLINGTACRLKDVNELFMDTGIGKEGYSIIGQGQIDRILSTKPEDRRELFDEAAGIVKYKKRKQVAISNLVEANDNIVRVTDIIRELESQLSPLEKQSAVAKEYLKLRDELKNLEINTFLSEYDKSDSLRKSVEEKLRIVEEDLSNTKSANENTRAEYEKLEATLDDYAGALEEGRSYKTQLLVGIEKKEGETRLFDQQIESLEENKKRTDETVAGIKMELSARIDEEKALLEQKEQIDGKQRKVTASLSDANDALKSVEEEMAKITEGVGECDRELAGLLSDEALLKQSIERYKALTEQINIRRSENASKLLTNARLVEESDAVTDELNSKLSEAEKALKEKKDGLAQMLDEIAQSGEQAKKVVDTVNELRRKQSAVKSRLETLTDMTERYEGYQGTVKKVMEMSGDFKGISGPVADIIDVDKKYETAVETALGASIQHIVVDDEQTAKKIIGRLKEEKLGRATFLPLDGIGHRNTVVEDSVFSEKGVLGDAYSLIRTEKKYEKVLTFLLKAFVVVDNVDNALVIARKYDHNLRIVTLEGEQLAPGGSIAGGAFKNAANLLGRKRLMQELEDEIASLDRQIKESSLRYEEINKVRQSKKAKSEEYRTLIGRMSIDYNSLKVSLENETKKKNDIVSAAAGLSKEKEELDAELLQNAEKIKEAQDGLEKSRTRHEELVANRNVRESELTGLADKKQKAIDGVSELRIDEANVAKAAEYLGENLARVASEKERLTAMIDESDRSGNEVIANIAAVKAKNDDLKRSVEEDKKRIEELDKRIEDIVQKREKLTKEHKSFFDSWEQLTARITDLEKEGMRLSNQRDRINESLDGWISHIWEEYELTVTTARKFSDENFKPSTARKDIAALKSSIKDLGDVNIGAIEDFKNVSERYNLLTTQKEDLIASRESINEIINDLDDKMRKQFAEQFEAMNREFDKVFKDLFAGGKGEIELVEGEDVLEAGIRIIAQPPGKKLQNMMQLSGGEKALTAIALLFAIQNLKPSPFCLLDEIEAALDDSNVGRFASFLKKLTGHSQFIIITHRRGTMACADILYGITMQEKGVSTLVSVSMIENELDK